MRLPPLSVLAVLLVAGCTGGGAAGTDDAGDDIDFGDVQATATTGVIRGLVVDLTINPLPGAEVRLTQPNRTAVSGPDGQFAFAGLEPGEYFLTVSLVNYTTVNTQATVVAGDSEPAITKVVLEQLASTRPYVDTYSYAGYITFGAAIGITSLGSTFFGGIGDDDAIWNVQFTQLPTWAQGELVWDQTQQAGGMLIWEMVRGNDDNIYRGYRETAESPALAYWNTTVLLSEAANVTDPEHGIDYRFFGGPHPLLAEGNGAVPPKEQCPTVDTGPVLGPRNPCYFGYGLTAQQRADGYIHNFYNFLPPAGWRFTVDGPPVVPDA